MFTHVLVGWEETDAGDHAVDVGAEVAHRFGARLAIVEVVPSVPHGGPDEAERARERARQTQRGERALARSRRHGVEAAFHLAEGRDPAEAMVEEAHRTGADLLVVGRRLAGGLERRLRGDVAEHAVRIARIPVLVVEDEAFT